MECKKGKRKENGKGGRGKEIGEWNRGRRRGKGEWESMEKGKRESESGKRKEGK